MLLQFLLYTNTPPTFKSSLFWLICLLGTVHAQQTDYTRYVLPFTGTRGGGNMFPGASRPFGVVKLGPDVFKPGATAYSGFLPDGSITGFSMLHESGTGGTPKYGVVAQMPFTGSASQFSNASSLRAGDDRAEVGYYRSSLEGGLSVELAASDHAGMLKYAFPSGVTERHVLVDLAHLPASARKLGLDQEYTRGNLTIAADGHYEGVATYRNGWNRAPDWDIYFCGRFDPKPTLSQTFLGDKQLGRSNKVVSEQRVGAVFSFGSANVTSTVGISFISAAKACAFADSEIPSTTTLEAVVSATKSIWNTNVLSKITTTSTNLTSLQLLYTSLYGMHLLPSNRTGENPFAPSSTDPYYDDLYTLWDLYRCTTSLWHLLQPDFYTSFLRSLLTRLPNTSYLPDAMSSNYPGRVQGGTSASNILADAFIKNVTHPSLNWTLAYTAMLHDATVPPPPNHDHLAPDSSTKEGRGALPDWLRYHYITPNFTRSVSRAVEYSGNDYAVSVLARGLSQLSSAELYLTRSRNWRNHWNPSATSLNYTGFLAQRRSNGSFVRENPATCGGCYWGDAYYQASSWEYSFGSHHDMRTLVSWAGGASLFTSRLKTLFRSGTIPRDASLTLFNPSNEPSFASPYLFNFANQQDLSSSTSRGIVASKYSATPTGLPGNSDAGAMQSWLLWNMLGLYPLTGQPVFLIGAVPWFEDLSMSLGQGRSVRITTKSATGSNVTRADGVAWYIQSLKVNGKPHRNNWLSFSDLVPSADGQRQPTLEFEIGPRPSGWDKDGELPPSPATEEAGSPPAPNHDGSERAGQHWRARDRVLLGVGVVIGVGLTALGAWLGWCLFGRRKSTGKGEGEVESEGVSETVSEGSESGVERRDEGE